MPAEYEPVLDTRDDTVYSFECDPDTGWPIVPGCHVTFYVGQKADGESYSWIAIPN
jgi:hypothetical protein